MQQRNVWNVVYDGETKIWRVIRAGGKRASSRHVRKDSAVRAASSYAQKNAPSQVRIHKADGTIQSEKYFVVRERTERTDLKKPARGTLRMLAAAADKADIRLNSTDVADRSREILKEEFEKRASRWINQESE